MSELPKQVQAQLEEAERIQRAMTEPPASAEPATATEVVATEPQPADPPEPPPQPAPAVPVETQHDAAYWQHKFKTLEGIHRSAADQLKAQGEHLRLITAQLEAMRQQTPQPAPVTEQPLVTTQDEEKFGSDLVDLARRVTHQEVKAVEKRLQHIEELIRRFAPQVERVGRVEQQVAQTREDRFWGELTDAVPDWETVNQNPAWIAWLGEYDPVAGVTRQESLNAAQAALDHRRVTGLFKLFKATAAPTPQPTRPNPAKAELARQVAPSRTSTVTVPPQGEKRYTGQDYTFWFDPRRTADRPTQEVATMKAELDRAHAEGRIDW
jgi:hypothetical protein